MSHFLVGVILPKRINNVSDYIEKTMQPFEELVDEQGNAHGKWDYYRVGGRYNGALSKEGLRFRVDIDLKRPRTKADDNNMCLVKDVLIENIPFAIVTPDGEWHEEGEMAMFGHILNPQEDWIMQVKDLFDKYTDNMIVGIDAHM